MNNTVKRKADTCFILFAKMPVFGGVKTRLAADMGDEFAYSLYKLLLSFQIDAHRRLRKRFMHARFEIHLAADLNRSFRKQVREFRELFNLKKREFRFEPQTGNDLGRRMEYSLRNALKKADYAVLSGSDLPALTSDFIAEAVQYRPDASFIKASDGGYTLIAVSRESFTPGCLQNIIYSRHDTLDQQLTRFAEFALPCHVSAEIPDCDTIRDLPRNILELALNGSGEALFRLDRLNRFLKEQ